MMRIRRAGIFILVGVCAITALIRAADEDRKSISIDNQSHSLSGKKSFQKTFAAGANPTEYALILEKKLEKHGSASYWNVSINGKQLGRLEATVRQAGDGKPFDGFHRIGLAVPAGILKDGDNKVVVSGAGAPAEIRKLELVNCSLQRALQMAKVTIKVQDGADNQPVPARITVVDERGQLTKLYNVRTSTNAVRPGVLYTLGEGDSFLLPSGSYTLYATRGMEWGVAKQSFEIVGGKPQTFDLTISREVDTPGFVACDSHIHTLPGSGHGDSTYEERMITIAGEGIEVAIATDHNHISDYRGYQRDSGTQPHFHSISGDEVTTHNGHFTAFPLDPANAVPGGVKGRNPLFLESKDWTELIADMRDKGAQVVILNHPYWPTIPKGPFGQFRFNRQTGGRLTGPEFNFNGLEVAQPANKTPDDFYALNDWLAMLNRGLRMTAVGATDSHTVNDPVGQARSYLESRTDEVSKIDRKDVYRAFVDGRASAAAGIFARLSIGEQYSMGDLVNAKEVAVEDGNKAKSVSVQLRVAAPSWVRPRDAMIYVNGRQAAKRVIDTVPDKPTDQTLDFTIDLPPYDAHVVAFVLGDGITLPGWTTYGKATQAIANPIYLDVDGDKKYSAPRVTAQSLIAKQTKGGGKLTDDQQAALLDSDAVKADSAVSVHVKDLLQIAAEKP